VAPLIFQHPHPVPATITPSTRPDPSDDPDALQSTLSSTYISHPLKGSKLQDTIALCAAPGDCEVPSTVNSIPRSIHAVYHTIVVSACLQPFPAVRLPQSPLHSQSPLGYSLITSPTRFDSSPHTLQRPALTFLPRLVPLPTSRLLRASEPLVRTAIHTT
jgi:hypothetical protein